MASVRRVVAGLFATLLACTGASLASAAPIQVAEGPEVEAFDIEQVGRLALGTRLNFSLYGTPGALAALRIEGAARELELIEVQPGAYEGSYVIDSQDRIPPGAAVSATLRLGERVVRAVLQEPLLLGAASPVPAPTPQGTASEPPGKSPPVHAARRDGGPPPQAAACRDCAVVESVRPLADPGVGRENRDIARAVGLIVRAGVPLPQRLRNPHEAVLRRPDGLRVIRVYDHTPPFRVGETIRLGVDLGGARAERMAPSRPSGGQ